MPDFFIVLFVILVVVTFITLAGHAVWVLLAMLFRGGPRREPHRECIFCGRPTALVKPRCEWCGKDLKSPLAAELADLQAMERQLRRFSEHGDLEPEFLEKLTVRVVEYRRQLQEPTPPKVEPVIVAEAVREAMPVATPAKAALAPAKPQVVRTPQAIVKPEPQAARELQSQVKPPAPPPPPRKSWAEMLAAFMEERNIRWGELIGGLLLVCSSVALVVSLWERLQRFLTSSSSSS